MRLIDADELKEVAHEMIQEDPEAFNGGYLYDAVTVEEIDEAPTIEAVPMEKINRVVMKLNEKEREAYENRTAYFDLDKKYRAYIQLGRALAYRDAIDILGEKVI